MATVPTFRVRVAQRGDAIELAAVCYGIAGKAPWSWRVRLTVTHDGQPRYFFEGDDSDRNKEPMDEVPPSIDPPWLRGGFPFDVTLELRVRNGKRSRALAGTATVAAPGTIDLALAPGGRLGGHGFDAGDETIAPVTESSSAHELREVTVPDVGLLASETDKSDFRDTGTELWLYSASGAKRFASPATRAITPPGEANPKNCVRYLKSLLR